MFNLGKKNNIKDPLDNLDKDKWLRDILVELNLIDVNNLIAMAEITTSKEAKKQTESFLKEIQPVLLANIKRGITQASITVSNKEYNSKYNLIDIEALGRAGMTVYINYPSPNEDKITINLYLFKK